MRITVVFFVVLFLSFPCWSQEDSVLLELFCIDSQKEIPIPNVSVFLNEKETAVYTNHSGIVQLYISCATASKIILQHKVYKEAEKNIRPKTCDDTIRLRFAMQIENIRILQEAIVKAPGVPDTVFQSERVSVSDFEILKDGTIVMLTYPKTLEKGSELVIKKGERITSFSAPVGAKELCRDYTGKPIILAPKMVYSLGISEDSLLLQPIEKSYYSLYVEPILDTSFTKVFFSNFSPDYPAFNYEVFDVKDSVFKTIQHIEDKLMMELYRSEYKWVDVRTKLWAREKEVQTGIDKEIWVGANVFTRSIYYKQLYAPFFRCNDSLLIFDHYSDKLYLYDLTGKPIDSVGIFYHYHPRKTGWKRELLQDCKTNRIFVVFEKDGYTYLSNLNLSTGKIEEWMKLEFPYVSSVQVYGNFAYYIYRPFESAQKKYLYRERLPIN